LSYKDDQDRFWDTVMRDLKDFREAATCEELAEAKGLVDKVATLLSGRRWSLFDNVEEARAFVVSRLKESGKLPKDFTYPE
jgi:hypothetical protein